MQPEQIHLIPSHKSAVSVRSQWTPSPGASLKEPLLTSANLRLVLGDFILLPPKSLILVEQQ